MNKLDIKAYYSVTTNIHIIIYDVIYDIEDKIKFSWNICGKVRKARCSKIQYDKKDVAILNHTISRFILMSAYVPTTN